MALSLKSLRLLNSRVNGAPLVEARPCHCRYLGLNAQRSSSWNIDAAGFLLHLPVRAKFIQYNGS